MRDFTEIYVVLDKSGSMAPLTYSTIAAFNKFVEEQKAIGDNANLPLCLFSGHDSMRNIYSSTPIKDVKPLTAEDYVPNGWTALNDAVCYGIDSLGNMLAATKESERPNKVVFVIQTDGHENNSIKHTLTDTQQRITHQQDKYNWQFLFLGANMDSIAVGRNYGIKKTGCLDFAPTSGGILKSMSNYSGSIGSYRMGKVESCTINNG